MLQHTAYSIQHTAYSIQHTANKLIAKLSFTKNLIPSNYYSDTTNRYGSLCIYTSLFCIETFFLTINTAYSILLPFTQ